MRRGEWLKAAAVGVAMMAADAGRSAPPEVPPVTPTETDAEARTEERAEEGRAQFEKTVKAYREAAAIKDTEKVTITMRAGAQEPRVEILEVPLIVTPEAGKVTLRGNTTTVIDGTVYVENAEKKERYFAMDFEGPMVVDPFIAQADMVPMVPFVMMYAPDPLLYLSIYTINPKVAGMRKVWDEAGKRTVREIIIDSEEEGAGIRLSIDPETNLVVKYVTQIRGRFGNEGEGITVEAVMTPEALTEAPAEEFAVETEGKRMVSNIGRLLAPPDTTELIGKDAPDFTAKGSGGAKDMRLTDQMGRAVVVAWWNVPGEGLTPVLDAMQAVADWGKAENVAVTVMPVFFGPVDDDVRAIWKEKGYTLPMLCDPEGRTAETYKMPLLPVVMVVRPTGEVHEVFLDLTATGGLAEDVKIEVKEAIAAGL